MSAEGAQPGQVEGVPKGVWIPRVLAAGLDVGILAICFIGFAAVAGDVETGEGSAYASLGWRELPFYLAFVFVYFWAFEWRMGATPGKRWNDVAVFAGDGGEPGAGRSAVRNLVRFVDWLPLLYFVGFVSARVDGNDRRRLGDRAAGTVVEAELSTRLGWDLPALAIVIVALAAGLGTAAAIGGAESDPASAVAVGPELDLEQLDGLGEGNEELLDAAKQTIELEGAKQIEIQHILADSSSSKSWELTGTIDSSADEAELRIAGPALSAVKVVIVGGVAWIGEVSPGDYDPPAGWYEVRTSQLVGSGLLPVSSQPRELLAVAGATVTGPAPAENPSSEEPLEMTEFTLPEQFLGDGAVSDLDVLLGAPLTPADGATLTGAAGIDSNGLMRSLRLQADCEPGTYSSVSLLVDPIDTAFEAQPPSIRDVRGSVDAEQAADLVRKWIAADPVDRTTPPSSGPVATGCPSTPEVRDPSF